MQINSKDEMNKVLDQNTLKILIERVHDEFLIIHKFFGRHFLFF